MTTTDKNKLIAEFMGYTQPHPDYPNATYWYKKGEAPLAVLLYDTNWDWLMPVVENIEGLETPITNNLLLEGKFETYEVHIENKHVKIYAHGEVTKEVADLKYNTKIEAVYNACVEFVVWYNQNKS